MLRQQLIFCLKKRPLYLSLDFRGQAVLLVEALNTQLFGG
jgi:hypothetical protein